MRYEAAWQELRQRAGAGRGVAAHVMLGPQPAGAGSPTAAGGLDNVVPLPARHDLQSGQGERLQAPLAPQPSSVESARTTPPPLPRQADPAQVPSEMGKTALERLVREAIKTANDQRGWYDKRASRVGKWSRGLRAGAIVFGVFGGLLPLFPASLVTAREAGAMLAAEAMAGAVGLVLFGLAGGCLLLDQAFGYSSSWMRYRLAELRLGKLIRTFALEIETELAKGGARSHPDQADSILARLKAFVSAVDDINIQETETWIAEFKAGLLQTEQFAKSTGKAVPGQK
jgi:SMODS and SLOG-associating 2TM effector domain 2